MVMSSSTGIVVLHDSGDNPGRLFAIVYDHAQPPARKRVLAIVALAIASWIQDMKVRMRDRVEDRIDVIEQPRSLRSEMQVRAGVEDDAASVWVGRRGTRGPIRAARTSVLVRSGWFRTGLSEVRKVEVSETALGLSTGFGGKAGPPGFLKIGTEGAGNGPGGFWCERRRWGKRWIAKAAVLVQMGLAAVFG
jgi:hypothetical protein